VSACLAERSPTISQRQARNAACRLGLLHKTKFEFSASFHGQSMFGAISRKIVAEMGVWNQLNVEIATNAVSKDDVSSIQSSFRRKKGSVMNFFFFFHEQSGLLLFGYVCWFSGTLSLGERFFSCKLQLFCYNVLQVVFTLQFVLKFKVVSL